MSLFDRLRRKKEQPKIGVNESDLKELLTEGSGIRRANDVAGQEAKKLFEELQN